MGRLDRSFRIVAESYRILMQGTELMVLPLLSGVCMAIVGASFFFGTVYGPRSFDGPTFVAYFLFYFAAYAIGLFFQAAVIVGATERLNGGNPTVKSALEGAARRGAAILAWAMVAATVGTLLRMIHDRVGFVGRIIVGLLGASWSLATFFVVPVLVLEDRSLPASFQQSVNTFKKTWGETFVVSASVGIASAVAWVTLLAVTGLLALAGAGIFALVVGAVGAIGLFILFSALEGIYVAALYRFATHGDSGGFNRDLLANAFVPK